jgi:hypothetical protein
MSTESVLMYRVCFCRRVSHARATTGRSTSYHAEAGAELAAGPNACSFPEYAVTATQLVAAGKAYALLGTEFAWSIAGSR